MKKIINLLLAAMLVLALVACGGQQEEQTEDADISAESEVIAESETSAESDGPMIPVSEDNAQTAWLPKGTSIALSETEKLPELEDAIAAYYDIPEESREGHRYYYSYVDLNDDGKEEIFAVVMGMYTSGSGGDSGLLLLPYAGMSVSQNFTLLRTPILVSDNVTDGAHDLIFLRSGGGSEPQLVRLTCTDGVYVNPSDAEVLENLDGITGTAILGNDLIADMSAGTYLTLAK